LVQGGFNMSDTDARPVLDLAALREAHDYPAGGWCHTCETELAPCLIARLVDAYDSLADELQAARSEIAYHHEESARWEKTVAAVGALDADAERERENEPA